jgi:uncharacterized membrane protein
MKEKLLTAVRAIEDAKSLDGPVRGARAMTARILPAGRLRDFLRGGPIGHPLHPVAVLVPAGAWISSAVLDFTPGQEKAARTLAGVGVIAAAPTALSGIADWSGLRQKQQRVGLVHWGANLLAVGLYSASFIQRSRGNRESGKVLGLLGLSVLGVSGYLGGHLAYRQGANVAIDTEEREDAESPSANGRS